MRTTRILVALALLPVLSACGVDGPPVPPPAKTEKTTGVTVGGTVRVGVTQVN